MEPVELALDLLHRHLEALKGGITPCEILFTSVPAPRSLLSPSQCVLARYQPPSCRPWESGPISTARRRVQNPATEPKIKGQLPKCCRRTLPSFVSPHCHLPWHLNRRNPIVHRST